MGAEREGIDIGNYTALHTEWELLGKPGKFHEWERERHDYPELLRLRDLYRDASPMTVRFWKLCNRAWDEASMGRTFRFGPNGCIAMVRDGRHNRLVLPSGRSIWYRNARVHYEEKNADRVDRRTFIGKSSGVGHTRVDTHGGKLCISGGALTLTDRGWVPLRDVLTSDQVWDGVEFVAHDGLISKGIKPVIDIEGVRMTPDHRIMQTGGWREAQQYDRSDWQDVGLPDGGRVLRLGAEVGRGGLATDVVGEVHLRKPLRDAERRDSSGSTRSEGPPEILRMPAGSDGFQNHLANGGRAQQAPALQRLADGEVSLHESDRPGVEELRRAGDHDVRPLASGLLGVRRGHGTDVGTGAGTGSDQQRRALRGGQLPLDDEVGASEQPQVGVEEQVYDLLNAGPRNRFTVLTENGPLLVHNCENITQAVARDALFDLIMKIESMTAAGWPGRIVLHVHDEVVLEVPSASVDRVIADTRDLMAQSPTWAPGLILRGEGSAMPRYSK